MFRLDLTTRRYGKTRRPFFWDPNLKSEKKTGKWNFAKEPGNKYDFEEIVWNIFVPKGFLLFGCNIPCGFNDSSILEW